MRIFLLTTFIIFFFFLSFFLLPSIANTQEKTEIATASNTHRFAGSNDYLNSFNVSFDNGLRIKANDTDGEYNINLKAFIELGNGKRQTFDLSLANIPFKKLNGYSYKYNITIPSLPKNLNYVGLYFNTSKSLRTEIEGNTIKFCGIDSCLSMDFSDIPINYTFNETEIKINVNGLSNLYIDPIVLFQGGSTIQELIVFALDTRTIVIANRNTTGTGAAQFMIYDTNGTLLVGPTTVYPTGISFVSGVAVNSNLFFITYDPSTSYCFAGYNRTGSKVVNEVCTGQYSGTGQRSSLCSNSTHFYILSKETSTSDVESWLYNSTGTLISSIRPIEDAHDTSSLKVDCLGDTVNSAVVVYSEDTHFNMYLRIINGTQTSAATNIKTNRGIFARPAAFNSTVFGLAYNDSRGINITVFDSTRAQKITPIRISILDKIVEATRIDDDEFAVIVANTTNLKFGVYRQDGTATTPLTIIANSPALIDYGISIFSSSTASGISLCSNKSVVAFSNTTGGYWVTVSKDGTVWNGQCDETAPQYSLNSTNSTVAETDVKHSLNWTDDTGLSSYIFSFCNCSNTTRNSIGLTYDRATDDIAFFINNGSYVADLSQANLVSNIDFVSMNTFTYYGTVSLSNVVGVVLGSASNDFAMFLLNGSFIEDLDVTDLNQAITLTGGTDDYTIPAGFTTSQIVGFASDDYTKDDVAVFFNNGSFCVDTAQTTYSVDIAFTNECHAYTLPTGYSYFDVIGVVYDGELYNASVFFANGSFATDTNQADMLSDMAFDDYLGTFGYPRELNITKYDMVNGTAVSFNSGTWSNVTKTVNSTVGCTIRWGVYANDTSNNWNKSETFSYATTAAADTTAPTYSNVGTNDTAPHILDDVKFYSQWNDYALDSYIFSWNGTGVTCGTWANDSSVKFTSGNWTNTTKQIPATCLGTTAIGYRFYANDTSNNQNDTGIVALTEAPPQNCMIEVTANATYGTNSNITCYSTLGTVCSLFRNNTNVSSSYNNSLMLHPAGLVNFSCNGTDSINQTWFNVSKGGSVCENEYNKVNRAYGFSDLPPWKCYVTPTILNATLWRNVTTSSNYGTSPVCNDVESCSHSLTDYPASLNFFKCNSTGNQNYSSCEQNGNRFLNVSKGNTSMSLYLNGTQDNYFYNNSQIANFTAVLNATGKTIYMTSNYTGWVLQQNTTSVIFNYTNVTNAGNWNLTAYFDTEQNYTGSSQTYYFNVTGALVPPEISIIQYIKLNWLKDKFNMGKMWIVRTR